MAWSITSIGSNTGAAGATLTLTGVTVPAGALIIVCTVENGAAAIGTVSDSVNGSYTNINNGNFGTVGGIFYFNNTASLSSATITFTKNASGNDTDIAAFYATGQATSSVVDTAASATNFSGGGNPTVTSGTPANSGDLFVGMAGPNTNVVSWTQSTGFTNAIGSAGVVSVCSLGLGYAVNAGTTALTYNPTVGTAGAYPACIAAFIAGGAATPAVFNAGPKWSDGNFVLDIISYG